jgi:hypothetical protein
VKGNFYVEFKICKKSLKIPKGGNQNPLIEDRQHIISLD